MTGRSTFRIGLAFVLSAIGLVVLVVMQALLFFEGQIGGKSSDAMLARGAIALVIVVLFTSYVLGAARALWKEWRA